MNQSEMYEYATKELRMQLAKDIELLKDSCIRNDISESYILGLTTAQEIITGEVRLHPSVYQDPNQPTLFDVD